MRIAHVISDRSKDPSTQTGAVIVDKDNVVVGLGYNGLPRGINNEKFPWNREGKFLETKYAYVCHAEENAIYNSNKDTGECKIYCTLFPCNECAKTIIQNRINEVIYGSDKYHDTDVVRASRKLLKAAGIKCRQHICDQRKNK